MSKLQIKVILRKYILKTKNDSFDIWFFFLKTIRFCTEP